MAFAGPCKGGPLAGSKYTCRLPSLIIHRIDHDTYEDNLVDGVTPIKVIHGGYKFIDKAWEWQGWDE